MGCDLHGHAEKRVNGKWENLKTSVFDWRDYGIYGFLAGIRNYSAVPPLSEPRGMPDDVSPETRGNRDSWDSDGHSASWLSMQELTQFDYERGMEDRRVMRNNDGGCTCDPGEGEKMTYRQFLGEDFFDELEKLKADGAERIVFWFDN